MSDTRIEAAFRAMPRSGFLPDYQRAFAGQDRPLAIGWDQTNSQPSTVANMLEFLAVEVGQRVLDVGAGSGWTTALLGHLVGPAGRVIGVELVPGLAEWGAGNLGRTQQPWATIETADPNVLGVPTEAPFDRILVSAGAQSLPDELVGQLGPGGILVAPVAQRMMVVRRHLDGSDEIEEHGRYSFVPLIIPHS